MIFDTHAHYDDEAFNEDRDAVLRSLAEHGIEAVVNVGASIQTTKNTLELMKKYPFVYGAVGVHPSETAELNDHLFDWLRHVAGEKKVVAIGEIGLDYHWDEPEPELQKTWFVRQLGLAREKKLPVIIHSRDAAKDTLDIIKAEKAGEIGGVIHCFSYSLEMAKEYLNMGFYLGIGGMVTFQNAKRVAATVEAIPLEHLLIETDSPYLAPMPMRGKRNDSKNLRYITERIAQIKQISPEEVARVTSANAKKMFGIQ